VLNDKWTLERLLGVGGMGAVYAGRHRNGARAAVKVLHRALSKFDEVRARFLREGYAANRVGRPGVVKVLDDDIVKGGPDDGTAYLVMELLAGESLDQRVQSGRGVSEREFLVVADAVLDVLEGAHASGVVHRDIKPENIFIAVDESGAERVKVLDFGLARLLEARGATAHGVAVGTPSFMSPEQAAGRNDEVDGRTDLYALAATGFVVLTGRRIHDGEGAVDRVVKMASLPAPRIRSAAPDVSEEFARVIDHALEFRRESRYQTAAEMRADVQRALDLLGGAVPLPVVVVSEKSVELSAADLVAISKVQSAPSPEAPPQPSPALPVALPDAPPRDPSPAPPASPPAAVAPAVEDAAPPPAPAPPETSAVPLPPRNSLVSSPGLALTILGFVVVVVVAATLTRSREAPPTSLDPGDAEVAILPADESPDASLEIVTQVDAGAPVGRDASLPRPRGLPRRPAKPSEPGLKPWKHPKR